MSEFEDFMCAEQLCKDYKDDLATLNNLKYNTVKIFAIRIFLC
jgi:hypothetical protein